MFLLSLMSSDRRVMKLQTHSGTVRKSLSARLRVRMLGASGSPGMVVSLLWDRSRVLKEEDHSLSSGRLVILLSERFNCLRSGSSSKDAGTVERKLD